jgi:rhamnulokinase
MSYLAFDLGASSGRAVRGWLEGGVMRMEEVHRFATPLLEDDGHLYWDVDALWAELQAGLRRALAAAPDLRSLSVDSWGVDYVSLDADGQPVHKPYCYRDPRTEGMMARAFQTLPAGAIYAHTGIQFLPFNTLYQLLADQSHDAEALRRVYQHLPIADYFNYQFCGRAVVEVSMASTTQLMDVRARQWAEPLLRAFGLAPDQWPPIVPSGTVLGPVRQAPHLCTIATCSHDTGCAVAATPVTITAPWAFISCGTWSLMGVERYAPLLMETVWNAGFTHEAGVDGTIRFLKNLTGLWPLQECAREWGLDDWSRLEQEARAAAPGVGRIHLEDPRFLARGGMEARLRAYVQEHGIPMPDGRGALVRLILESLADSYRRTLDELQHLTGQRIETLYLFGGGARNTLLCELTARTCGVPVVAGPEEATALGNLLLQARALGDLPPGASLRAVAARSSTLAHFAP